MTNELKDRVEKELEVIKKIKGHQTILTEEEVATIDVEAYFRAVDLIKDQQARIDELESREKVLTSALKAVLDDLKSRARWDDEVKVIPLGSSVYINAEQALSSINPTRSENENPKAP